jgi:hypothetical protein
MHDDSGPGLLAGLLDLQPAVVCDADSVRVVALWARVRAWLDAQAMRALSDCCPSRSDSGDAELTVHEVAAMTHTSQVSTGTELALMMQVRDALPLCWEALDTATLTLAHVKALAGVLSVVPSDVSVRVEAAVVPPAVAAGWTPAERAETARELCDVRLVGEDHEMASLVATADAVTSRAVMDVIDAAAQQRKRDGDTEVLVTIDLATLLGLTRNPW